MQRATGRYVLPAPGSRRFRLSQLPAEDNAERPLRAGLAWRRAAWVSLWLCVSAAGVRLSEGEAGAPGLRFWSARQLWSTLTTPAEPAQPVLAVAPAQVPVAAPVVHTPPPAPPRVVAGLAPIERQSPDTHQGAQYSSGSNLPSGFRDLGEVSAAQRSADELVPGLDMSPERAGPDRPASANLESNDAQLAAARPRVWTQVRGESCERAYESFQDTLDMAATDAPDISRQAFAQRLEDFGSYARCDLNQPRAISICVAVQGGSAKGVTVKTEPADARLAACVAEAVSRIHFPQSPRMDLVRTELTVR